MNKCSSYGKPSSDTIFAGDVSFEHILVVLCKSTYIFKPGKEDLQSTNPLFNRLDNIISLSNKIEIH